MITNNVTRFLDSKKISYKTFELPTSKLGAVETANYLGIPASIVYKTIVVVRDKPAKPVLAVIPGEYEVDLKLLARFLDEKKVHLPTERETEAITHLQTGGISPLALLNRGFCIVLDESAKEHNEIHISGGQRGLNIRLQVEDLIKLTSARVGPICTKTNQQTD